MALEILVLAAGVGKRMRSSLPKVLQPLAGRPLLAHVLATARELWPRKVIVVHGHGAEAVRQAFNGENVEWALQDEQLGTAHAVMQAMPQVSADAATGSAAATARAVGVSSSSASRVSVPKSKRMRAIHGLPCLCMPRPPPRAAHCVRRRRSMARRPPSVAH